MTGVAYATSAEMADELGAFPGYEPNAADMLRVVRNHRRAAYGQTDGYEKLGDRAGAARPRRPARATSWSRPRRRAWDRAIELGEAHGYRNAQATVIAPTGTIGLVMDCDTTGIEPDFALVKFKKLAGGGYFKIINQAVPEALRGLGYGEAQIAEIGGLCGRPRLAAPGARHQPLDARRPRASPTPCWRSWRARSRAPSTSSSSSTGGRSARSSSPATLNIPTEKLDDPAFDLLPHLGFSKKDIEAANEHVCGAMTLEGAPHLKDRAPAGVRLRQPVRPQGQALPVGRRATST